MLFGEFNEWKIVTSCFPAKDGVSGAAVLRHGCYLNCNESAAVSSYDVMWRWNKLRRRTHVQFHVF